MTRTASPLATDTITMPIIITQTQDSDDHHSDGSPEDEDSSVDPCIDVTLCARHLQLTNEFFEATQSRCSKLVSDFLRRKMKVKKTSAWRYLYC